MTTPPKDRQDLYNRIRETSRNEVILEEMQRLGFWPAEEDRPGGAVQEERRIQELERELRALTTENARLQNAEALRKALRQQRLEQSRRKQQETKERKERERAERAQRWELRREREIVYLGDDVSAGLNQLQSDSEKLARNNLPGFESMRHLAEAMGITLGELRFLAFSRRVSRVSHYQRFAVPKKSGGQRLISAPMPRLKRAQRWILENVLEKPGLHDAAHGFRRERSIVSNARPHVAAHVVVNVDISDFFPTVTYRRIRGVFRSLGYGEAVATVLALLCSEPETDRVTLDGETYYVARGERFLPQGAPTSPALTNLICRGLDARLSRIAQQLRFVYTRYADDMTFSGDADASQHIGRLLGRIRHVVREEGFQVHPDKTRILRSSQRQEVTGIVVNRQVNVSRRTLRRFRATLFQIEQDGPRGKRWGNSSDVIAGIEGFANFVAMVDPAKGGPLQDRVQAIIRRYGRSTKPRVQRQRWRPKEPPVRTAPMADLATGERSGDDGKGRAAKPHEESTAKKPWWKFW
jgi:retron-type reverse transcriptase